MVLGGKGGGYERGTPVVEGLGFRVEGVSHALGRKVRELR